MTALPPLPLPPVSRETADTFLAYEALLRKWQAAINLVGPDTLPDFYNRHINDSLQILPHIPESARTVYDLGSGAGFPGMVLAMARPDLSVHLIESVSKKASFLRTVSRETGVSVYIHNDRIESLPDLPPPDVVTARALAPLPELLDYCRDWAVANPTLTLIFLKGRQSIEEIKSAEKKYSFARREYISHINEMGRILVLSDLCIK